MPFRGKRRRFGSRYPRRFSRFGRRKSVKKRLVGTAGRAAARRRTPNMMCKDIGTIYPSCMVLRCRQSGLFSLGDASLNLTNAADAATGKYYFVTIPIQPTTTNGLTSSLTAITNSGTALNLQAYGLARLFNTAGATGVYQRACVLKCKVTAKLHLTMAQFATIGTRVPGGRWTHFLHTRDGDGEALTAPSTQALADRDWAQPDVRRRIKDTMLGTAYLNSTSVGINFNTLPPQRVVWRHTVWPHKELDMSFESYVSTESSFCVPGTVATNRSVLELGGYGNSCNGYSQPEASGSVYLDVEWTLLLKDPFASVI